MRNLKKVLALVLALVMSLSLVTIANATDFSDDADIDYEEAVDVMSAIGVIDGVGNNSFDPDGTLTREQAAKLIAYMLMGTNADKLGVEQSSFKDVAATRWSAPAIEYCATLGIIDGAGDGNFYPAGKLTGYAFAKMLLTAIGYDSKIEGFTGSSWTINVATMGMSAGLHNGMENVFGSAELSRQEAAQMALNAIKAPLVQYTNGTTVTVGGQEVSVGSSRWEYVTTTIARQQNISDRRLTNAGINAQNTGYTVEFGEKYFPNLRLVSESDNYERPSHTWVYENKELGTYVDYDLLVEKYTEGVSHKTLYDLLGRSNLENYKFEYYVDGIEDDTLTAKKILERTTVDAGYSGNGVLTQVFVDHDYNDGEGLIKITSIRTWLGKVTTGYNEKREQATITVYVKYSVDEADSDNNETVPMAANVGLVDVPGIEDLKEDDYVLVNMSGKGKASADPDSVSSTKWDIVKVSDVEILTDTTLTAFSKGSDKDWTSNDTRALFKSVTADGKKYNSSAKAAYSDDALELYNGNLLTNKTYNIYLDQYGYAIGVDLYAGADNYVFITGFDTGSKATSTSNADATAIFVDGSVKSIKVNVKDTNKNIENAVKNFDESYFRLWKTDASNYDDLEAQATVNRWFTYTEDDGIYTLSPALRMVTTQAKLMTAEKNQVIKCSNVVLDSTAGHSDEGAFHPNTHTATRVYGNDDSVFLVAELDTTDAQGGKVITGVEGVYTGVQNVDITLYTTVAGAGGGDDGPIKDTILVNTDEATLLYDNTYTVYDKNNYIIASVVLGDVSGSNANYVYTLTAAKEERKADGKYYWDFDAVVDGQVKTLTVESKFVNAIGDIRPGHVQEVRYSGDYVVNVETVKNEKIFTDDFNKTSPIDPKTHAVYDMGHVPNSGEWDCKKSCSSYATGYTTRLDVEDLMIEGRTMYLVKGSDWGLTMASKNTPTVLIQDEGGDTDVITEYADITAAKSAMADANGDGDGFGFAGRITAVLDDQGRAKWVVIISDTEVEPASGGNARPSGKVTSADWDDSDNEITFKDKNGDGVKCTFVLEQLLPGGWEEVDTFTTNNDGVYELPTLSGNTYRVITGSFKKTITDAH